ncbi:RNA polymerase sigma factor [Luteolibacter soli]|uniref:Sigma-70 family RNA polymerase sigma factor n=1 Tax=Luteolibacter soli TaxID=3135280 RepID=A0ABU9ANZ5_9BACT
MSDRPDASLLEAWSAEGSEEAFAVLARRYGGLLYHAALRRTGRDDLAGEAAQNSLLILARKAPRLTHLPTLAGWLHRTACYEASKLLRRESRHQARMKHLPLPDDDGDSAWKDAAPLLDQALDDLPEKDRQVIFLKYFDGLSFEQMARQFGGEPAAWRQRGSRAVERLRLSLTKRGIAVSSAALGSGLGTSLTQAAPPAVAASLGATPAAVAALSWKTLTLHSLHLMKIKPAVVIAAVLLLSLAPLGMQAMAISDARQRIALLESSNLVVSSGSSSRQTPASDRSAAPVNLLVLADALLAAKEGDLVKRFTTEKKVEAMSADELERLLVESTSLELGPEQRNALVYALYRQFCLRAQVSGLPSERVVGLALRLSPFMKPGDGSIWNLAGDNLNRWADQNPEEAAAWYRENSSLSRSADAAVVGARAFDGLYLRSPEDAAAFFRSLSDERRQAVIGGGAGLKHPEVMVGLAGEMSDPVQRGQALNQIFSTAGERSTGEIRGWIDQLQPSNSEASQWISLAAGRFTQEMSLEQVAKKLDWVRETAAGLDPSEAAGVFLDGVGYAVPNRVKEVLDAEWERHPDERMLATYISRCMFSEDRILDAIPRSQLITDRSLRDSALQMMLLSSREREDARELARKGGMAQEEIDRLIPRKP